MTNLHDFFNHLIWPTTTLTCAAIFTPKISEGASIVTSLRHQKLSWDNVALHTHSVPRANERYVPYSEWFHLKSFQKYKYAGVSGLRLPEFLLRCSSENQRTVRTRPEELWLGYSSLVYAWLGLTLHTNEPVVHVIGCSFILTLVSQELGKGKFKFS